MYNIKNQTRCGAKINLVGTVYYIKVHAPSVNRRANQIVSHRNQFSGHLLFVIEITFNIHLLHKQKNKHLGMFMISFVA